MSDLIVERERGTTVITLNRPAQHNALGGTLPADFAAAVREFAADPDQFAAVITGSGEKTFCSGADLGDLSVSGDGISPIIGEPDLFGLGACDKPLIAAINGAAIGGGLELALLCDVRLASQNAWFALPEVNWGFMPGIAVNMLPNIVSLGTVSDMLLFGERMTAEEAHRCGIVQALTPPREVLAAALRKASAIAASSQATVRATKRMLQRHRKHRVAELHRNYVDEMQSLLMTGDAAEGLLAFREKRKPHFARR